MQKKEMRLVAFGFFILGIFFLINPNLNITGAVIGTSALTSTFSLILGLVFMIFGIAVLSESKNLEKLVEVEKTAVEEGEPIIIDTNYFIEASRDDKKYKELKEFIQYNFDHGQPVIVPKKVLNEIKNIGNTPGEKDRIKSLREILPKQTVSVEDLDKKWSYFKNKYDHLAKDILQQTPKYISFMYLSGVKKGESMDIEKFLNRNFGKLNDAFSRDQYKTSLQDAERSYLASKNKDNTLKGYNISQADIDVLSEALYLHDNPSIVADSVMDKVNVVSKDSHLLDSLKILNKSYVSKKGKIKITDNLN
ncbi:MAG: hypothetical protein ACP5NZ_00075 [Nanobdellota archaeon]